MFFYLRLWAFGKFSVKVIKFGNLLVLSIFRNGFWLLGIVLNLFLIKVQKKFAQTKIYYKFALA
jgi:hypothetical protein